MANLGDIFAKGRDVAGAANALRDYLPESVTGAIDSVLGGNILPLGDRKGINRFRSTINAQGGFQRSNHFYVTISNPKILRGDIGPILLPFLTDSTNLPGVSFATSEVRRYGTGPIERKPYAPIFTDIQMSFYGDGSGTVHRFFYEWMNGIIKFDNGVNGKAGGKGKLKPYEVEFKNDYAVDIIITTIDEKDRKLMEFKLYGAYPIALGDVAMSWGDTDGVIKIPVTFTFNRWKRTDVSIDIDEEFSGLSSIQKILKVGSAIQTLASLKKPKNIADITNIVNNSKTAVGGIGSIFR